MTKEEKLDILEKKYLEEFGHEMEQWKKEYLMRLLKDDPKLEDLKEEECKDCQDA